MASLLLPIIYLAFISLGLPDAVLGAAWPIMSGEFHVPISYAGIISVTISAGTIISSLMSDRLTRRFGTARVTAVSVAMTACALLGFSFSSQYWMLLLWAVPYGLGAGSVDAALNNYVALHYKAQHMSWLHCMWGVGASISPFIMSFALASVQKWNVGYFIVSAIQWLLFAAMLVSLPIWEKGTKKDETAQEQPQSLTFREIFSIKGALPCFFTFFCYCSLELTTSLWASSYLVQKWSFTPDSAAGFASMFYLGVTFGRFANGFLAMKLSDHFLIRMGIGLITVGIALLFVPLHHSFALIGFIIIGLGCAPIYPCIIHMTPTVFGKDKSQAMIGVQMAFAYIGFLLMPPLFGIIAEHISISLLPAYQLVLLVFMFITHELVAGTKRTA